MNEFYNSKRFENCSIENFLPNPNTVDVWLIEMDRLTSKISRFFNTMNTPEKIRNAKLIYNVDKQRNIISCGLTRELLGQYINIEPSEVTIEIGAHGKPLIPAKNNSKMPGFNISHSENMMLFVTSLHDKNIGIDIEAHRNIEDLSEIADSLLNAEDKKHFLSFPEDLRKYIFFDCWTKKEAIVKAAGIGLSASITDIRIPLNSGKPINVALSLEYHPGLFFKVMPLPPIKGYSSALALSGRNNSQIRYFSYC